MNRRKDKSKLKGISVLLSCFFVSVLPFYSLYAEQAPEPEKATISRDSELRESPVSDANVLVVLPAQSEVQVLERKGAWASVKTDKDQTGYVRLLNLRTISQSSQGGDSGIRSLISTFRTGSSGQSVATGVKGMSAEQLEKAKADRKQLKLLASFQAEKKVVKKEARSNGLDVKNVKALPEPEEDQ